MQNGNFWHSAIYRDTSTLIDDWLPEAWLTTPPLRLLVAAQPSPTAEDVRDYAHYLGHLLGAEVTDTPADLAHLPAEAQAGYDLTVFGEAQPSYLERIFKAPTGGQAVKQIPGPVLIARQPRWPLRQILWVTRGQSLEENALAWLTRLAQPSRATITVLAVLPPAPTYFSEALERYGLVNWLQSGTPLGEQLRRLEQELPGWSLEGRLRFRPGTAGGQIKQEVTESQPDLVILSDDPAHWWQKQLTARLVSTALPWIDRPMLVTKQAQTAQYGSR